MRFDTAIVFSLLSFSTQPESQRKGSRLTRKVSEAERFPRQHWSATAWNQPRRYLFLSDPKNTRTASLSIPAARKKHTGHSSRALRGSTDARHRWSNQRKETTREHHFL